ncbi:MAG: hypothetical protein ACPGED_01855 [Flavobacteriales bacterium]
MKQLILLLLAFFAFTNAKSQYLNNVILEPANQDSTFTLIGYDDAFTEYDFLKIASDWTVGSLSMDQTQKGGYQLLPIQTKSDGGSLLLACVLIHSSLVNTDELSKSPLGYYKMNSLEGCLAVSAIPKSMIGVLGKKDMFLALMSQLTIQARMMKNKDFDHVSSMFKDAEDKQFVFDGDLFLSEQIDDKNGVVKLTQLATQVHFYSKEAKRLEADYYAYPISLPKTVGGGTYFCVYSLDLASFYSEPLLSFKGSDGNLSDEQLITFERVILNPKKGLRLLGK